MSLSQKHKKFADEFIKNSDSTLAYMAAYPSSKKEVARVNGYRLLQKATIQEYIKTGQKKIEELTHGKLSDKLSEEELKKILSNNRKRAILRDIAESLIEVEDLIIVRGEVKKVRRKPNFSEIVKAIMEDNKMAGDHAPTNQNINVTGELIELTKNGNFLESTRQNPAAPQTIKEIE